MFRWRQWGLFQWGLLAVLVYGGAWAATALWGPAALNRHLQQELAEYDEKYSDSNTGTLGPTSVPVPFVVYGKWAMWSTPRSGASPCGVGSDIRAIWIFGWMPSVSKRYTWNACG